jgi:hypothetical protein
MNPILQTILLTIGTAAATAIAAALVALGPILAGLMKLLGLTVISKMAVHSVEQTNKNDPPEVKKQLAAAKVAIVTKWCGLSDATSVTPIANEAHVFALPSVPPNEAKG